MPPPELIIEAGRTERHYWRDLWRYRELFYLLAWRDILVRYKQTVIGALWAVIRPFLTIVVLTVVFGTLAHMPSEPGVPYALLVLGGTLPWQLFTNAFSGSGGSLVGNAHLISKVYFPRLIIPASAIIVGFVDFLISAAMLAGLMIWDRYVPDWHLLVLPAFILMALLTAFGAGLWIAALNVKYRDFQHVVPFIVQFGLYVSPVGYRTAAVPEDWRLAYSLNPLVGVIDGFRWALFRGTVEVDWGAFRISCAVIAVMLITGIWYFRRTERTFADTI